MESVWSCDCILLKKTFYVSVDRLGQVSYHFVFHHSGVLKEFKFKRDFPAFLIGQVLHGSVLLNVQLCIILFFCLSSVSVQIITYLMKVIHYSQYLLDLCCDEGRGNVKLWFYVQSTSLFNSESSPLFTCKISRQGNSLNKSYQ